MLVPKADLSACCPTRPAATARTAAQVRTGAKVDSVLAPASMAAGASR
jgi:hypothetical protein